MQALNPILFILFTRTVGKIFGLDFLEADLQNLIRKQKKQLAILQTKACRIIQLMALQVITPVVYGLALIMAFVVLTHKQGNVKTLGLKMAYRVWNLFRVLV